VCDSTVSKKKIKLRMMKGTPMLIPDMIAKKVPKNKIDS
jgi:hypothetical protein